MFQVYSSHFHHRLPQLEILGWAKLSSLEEFLQKIVSIQDSFKCDLSCRVHHFISLIKEKIPQYMGVERHVTTLDLLHKSKGSRNR